MLDFPDTPVANQVFRDWRWDGDRWLWIGGFILHMPMLIEVGMLIPFARDPGTAICARGGVATGGEAYIEPDGSSYSNALFPDLAAFFNHSPTIFIVPNMRDTGRFLRHRTASLALGTPQNNQNRSHTHDVYDPGHSHGVADPGHQHGIGFSVNVPGGDPNGDALFDPSYPNTRGPTDIAYTGLQVNGAATNISLNPSGAAEARPEAWAAFYGIKT